MRRISPLVFVLLLSACGDWPKIDAPPLAEDDSVGYTAFDEPEDFTSPVVEIDPNAAEAEEELIIRAEALRARAAQLRAREI